MVLPDPVIPMTTTTGLVLISVSRAFLRREGGEGGREGGGEGGRGRGKRGGGGGGREGGGGEGREKRRRGEREMEGNSMISESVLPLLHTLI